VLNTGLCLCETQLIVMVCSSGLLWWNLQPGWLFVLRLATSQSFAMKLLIIT